MTLNIEAYWNLNKENFPQYDGWIPLIKEMLFSLFSNGFPATSIIKAKEKYGEFVFLSETEFGNPLLTEIADNYVERINKSCQECGERAETISVRSWDNTLCLKHYIDYYPKILNINVTGFEIEGEVFQWEAIQYINFRTGNRYVEMTSLNENLTSVCLKFKSEVLQSKLFFAENKLSVSNEYINWFKFLRTMSVYCSNKFLCDYVKMVDNMLKNCPICGYVAVLHDECQYCGQHLLNIDSWVNKYPDHIKNNQLFWYSFTYRKTIKLMEKSFLENQNHIILFSQSELDDLLN